MQTAAYFNWVDYIIIGVFSFSILAGLMRGLIKEIIAVLTWISAFVISSLFASPLAAYFTGGSVKETVSGLSHTVGVDATQSLTLLSVSISFIAIFIGILIIGSVINYFVSRAVDAGGISVGNRILGGVFGLIRGFLINLVLVFLIQLSPLSLQAVWTQSLFVQSFQPIVHLLENMVQPGLQNMKVNLNHITTQNGLLNQMKSYFSQ